IIAISTCFCPGASIRLREELPSAPAVGGLNAVRSSQAAVTSARGRFGERNGLPMRSHRSFALPSTLLSCPVVHVSGGPLLADAIRERDQPFKSMRTADGPFMELIDQTADSVNVWWRSLLVRARSRDKFR